MKLWSKKECAGQGLPEMHAIWVSDVELGLIWGCIEGIATSNLLDHRPDYKAAIKALYQEFDVEAWAAGIE